MIKNYLKLAWRNLKKHKTSFIINIGGLSLGMAVTILIGMWVWDELSFNKTFPAYKGIAQVLTNANYNGGINTDYNTSPPYAEELRKLYGADFKQVLMTSLPTNRVLSFGEKNLIRTGYFFEPGIANMLNLKMIQGSREGLMEPASIFLSASVAKALFGEGNPMGKILKIDNKMNVVVTGIYEDIPYNTDFSDMEYIAPWQLYITNNKFVRLDNWEQDGYQTFVQLADHADMAGVSQKIRNLKLNRVDKEKAKANPQVFLLPMSRFHLYSDFENGVPMGKKAQMVWMYGIIGIFVLLLACINFMNLATARSEKRAREVGIRKTIGSLRIQLVIQFLVESMLLVFLSLLISIALVLILLPVLNEVADKKLVFPWGQGYFWLMAIGCTLLTGFIAGSYPALYLSSFQPVKVLKGTFKAGKLATIPRKALVVLQFTISITLIIGVMIVYRQIQLGKVRDLGYQQEGLMTLGTPTDEVHDHMEVIREELKKSGAIKEMAETLNPVTMLGFAGNGFQWNGRQPDENFWIGKAYITPEYGKTIGWRIIQGRDLSRNFPTDSSAVILNESMVRYMGVKNPLGMEIRETLFGKTTTFHVVGVVKDMLMQSPYRPVKETIYIPDTEKTSSVCVRLNPQMNLPDDIRKIEAVFKKYAPSNPFQYSFVDSEYQKKFGDEERVGKLASGFALLAIFISCLGLFGMASFIAEQRTKEIGVRKVLGASIFNIWAGLSREFVLLVLIGFLIASPLAYYFMNQWLQDFPYHTHMSWWIFGLAGAGALVITLATVSQQAIRAALANPVKSLRIE